MKFKELLMVLNEKWVEYNFNFGENKKEGMNILKKIRKKNKQSSSLPGEEYLTKKTK